MSISSFRGPFALTSICLYFSAAVLLLSLTSMASAQAVGSTRGLASGEGINTIQGRVYFPAGDQKGKAIKLHLESNLSIANQTAVTDQDGVFRFNNLPP